MKKSALIKIMVVLALLVLGLVSSVPSAYAGMGCFLPSPNSYYYEPSPLGTVCYVIVDSQGRVTGSASPGDHPGLIIVPYSPNP